MVREENGYSWVNISSSMFILILPIDMGIDSRENIRGRANNHDNHEIFPFESFCHIWYCPSMF